MALGRNDYVKRLEYDRNYSLIAFPILVVVTDSTYTGDFYWQNLGNKVVLAGGMWYDNTRCVYGICTIPMLLLSRLMKHS